MKKPAFIFILIFLSFITFAQNKYFDFSNRGEVYFSFKTDDKKIIEQLARIISIDKIENNDDIIAYANEKEFNKFLEFGIEPQILTPPSMLEEHKMFTLDDYYSKAVNEWDSYPTYEAYIAMMEDFENDFPDLCETIEFCTTVNNRKLLICKITSDINPNKKTKVHLSSTMHGDENTGYVLMLRLIDYILNNYETDTRIKNILDNAEIWICPNANPDGTYKTGNSNVSGATRYNGNNVDLNRNYMDDASENPHPDGNEWQPETVAFMALQEEQKFNLAVNIHGGAEVCNYPWDNKNTLSADNSWWVYVCREYADTVHVHNPSYMTYLNNGITRGSMWYMIDGGRQDYANYYDHCREFCLEISNTKTPTASTLPNYWNWNYRSFLNFIEQALYGIHGTTTDGGTGLPVKCSVVIESHDHTESHVFSNQTTGYYVRPIKAGTYTITYTAQGYDPEVRTLTVNDKEKIIQDIQFNYSGMTPDFSADNTDININTQVSFTDESYSINPITEYDWTFEGGTPSVSNVESPVVTYNESGVFNVSLTIYDGTTYKTITKEDYITVSVQHIMQNGIIETCDGYFLDSGGINGEYSNNENYIMTFKPSSQTSLIKVTFLEFDIEEHSSCDYDYLIVYDGPDTSSPSLGKYCGTNLPGPFISTADDGALTFVFNSDYSQTGAGWKAVVECIPTVAIPPIAEFSASHTSITINNQINFFDESENNPTSWEWTFEGGYPASSNEQNPIVTYYSPGDFDVNLKVSNQDGEDIILKENYINVTLSIDQFDANIKIYPNPAKETIKIESETLINEIEVIDLSGKRILHQHIKENNATININRIPYGVYLLNVQLENSKITSKIIISE
ncbi:MAG: PKD domain-containing protein [Bacteroidales bacterium]|jgi:PKD repeat protein|nr:PKD domain-containing protein [Bacteroidales bacterium]